MANLSASHAKHATLGAGVEDVVTLTGSPPFVEVINRDATAANAIGVKVSSVNFDRQLLQTATSATADNTYLVPGGGAQKVRLPVPDASGAVVHIFGAAASPYSVHGLWGQAVIPG